MRARVAAVRALGPETILGAAGLLLAKARPPATPNAPSSAASETARIAFLVVWWKLIARGLEASDRAAAEATAHLI
jgi:hypothetical protein